jgi:hypothetical protein
MRFTSRAEAFALRAELECAVSAPSPGPDRPSDDADRETPYRASRTALARWQTYSLHHFGLSGAYGKGWTPLRRQVLREEPNCRGCSQPSRVVDHILPVALGGSARARSNLQALCQPCHSVKTVLEISRLTEASWIIDPILKPPPDNEERRAARAAARGRPYVEPEFRDQVSALDHVRRRRERLRRLFGQGEGTDLLPQGVAALSLV